MDIAENTWVSNNICNHWADHDNAFIDKKEMKKDRFIK